VVFLDAIVVKVRDSQVVQNKPAYIAVGVDGDGEKHVLGIWLSRTPPGSAAEGEGARFWGGVMADLKNRGVRDILIACVDGLARSIATSASFASTTAGPAAHAALRHRQADQAHRTQAPSCSTSTTGSSSSHVVSRLSLSILVESFGPGCR
jgi:hypothetical protein